MPSTSTKSCSGKRCRSERQSHAGGERTSHWWDPVLTGQLNWAPLGPWPPSLTYLLSEAVSNFHSSLTTTTSNSVPRPLPRPEGWAAGAPRTILPLLYTWPAGPRFAERLWAAQSHTLVSAGLRARTSAPFLPNYPTENVRQKCVENEISNEVLSQLCKDETCTYVHKGKVPVL